VRRWLGVTHVYSRLDEIETRFASELAGCISERLDGIEARLTALTTERWTNPPVYLGDHTAVVTSRWGGKILVDTEETIMTPLLLSDGVWEPEVTSWLQRTLRPGQVFVDVGANVGYFTILGGQLVGHTGRVVAIEAHPRMADFLRRNVVLNSMPAFVTTWHRAAWSEATTLEFHLRVRYAASSSVSTSGKHSLDYYHDTEETVEVEAVVLDDLLSDLRTVDVIKIDVEGAEVHVLKGLTRTLKANPAMAIMFEWAPDLLRKEGLGPDALLDLLEDNGFTFRLLSGDTDRPISRSELFPLPYANIAAVR
jgi:FkbM family methyltransferase